MLGPQYDYEVVRWCCLVNRCCNSNLFVDSGCRFDGWWLRCLYCDDYKIYKKVKIIKIGD